MTNNGTDTLLPQNTTERVKAFLDAEPAISRAEIGRRLGIGEESVDYHLRKLGLKAARKRSRKLRNVIAPELKELEQALLTADTLLKSHMNTTMKNALAKAALSVVIEESNKIIKTI